MRFFVLMLPAVYALAGMVQSAVAADRSPDQPAQPTPPAEQAQSVAAPAAQAGMRVYVDPATGRRLSNPTAEQRANAAALDRDNPAFSTSSEGLREEPLPGGGVLVHLDGRFQSAVTVRRQADGALVQTCNNPIHDKLGAGHTHAAPVAVERAER